MAKAIPFKPAQAAPPSDAELAKLTRLIVGRNKLLYATARVVGMLAEKAGLREEPAELFALLREVGDAERSLDA